jgi:hypothetical protein
MLALLVFLLAVTPAVVVVAEECAWTDPVSGYHYDLSDMQSGKDYEKVVSMGLAIKFIYNFNICADTTSSCNGKDGASVETLQLSSGKNCRSLGEWERRCGVVVSLVVLLRTAPVVVTLVSVLC